MQIVLNKLKEMGIHSSDYDGADPDIVAKGTGLFSREVEKIQNQLARKVKEGKIAKDVSPAKKEEVAPRQERQIPDYVGKRIPKVNKIPDGLKDGSKKVLDALDPTHKKTIRAYTD